MKRHFKLEDADMLATNHFPVQAVFNTLYDQYFVERIEGISRGRGFGVNYGACLFPNDLMESGILVDESYQGVEFGLHNDEEVILDYETLYYYLKIICERYLEDFPQDSDAIGKSLAVFRENFHIQE